VGSLDIKFTVASMPVFGVEVGMGYKYTWNWILLSWTLAEGPEIITLIVEVSRGVGEGFKEHFISAIC
jgi:hypothetical protein